VVNDLAWSPGGGTLALSSSSGVAVYRVLADGGAKLVQQRVIKGKRPPGAISFGSRDDVIAVSDGSKGITLWDTRAGWTRTELKDAGSSVAAMALAPVDFLLAVATGDGKLRLWKNETLAGQPKVLDDFDTSPDGFRIVASGLSFDHTGRWVVTWAGWRTVHVWDLKTETRVCELDVSSDEGFSSVEHATLGPGPTLWVASFRNTRRWRLPCEDELPAFGRRFFSASPWAFHPEGKMCLARGDKGPEIVAAGDGKTVRKLGTSSRYGPVAFDRKGRWLALVADGVLSITDVRSGAAVAQEKLGVPALVVAIAPGGGLLAWGPNLNGLQIADLKKAGKWLKVPADTEVQESSGVFAVDPKGRYVATASWSARKSTIVTTDGYRGGEALPVLWQVTPGRLKRTPMLDGESEGVGSLAFSTDGEWLALGSQWGKSAKVKLFSTRTGKVRSTIELSRQGGISTTVQELAFDPRGKVLAATVRGIAKLFLIDLMKGTVSGDISLPQTARYSVTSLSFGPEGATVAVSTSGAQVLLYGVQERKLQKAIQLGDLFPQRVACSPDGKLVAAMGYPRKVIVRDGEVPAEGDGAGEVAVEDEGLSTNLVLYDIESGKRLHSAPAHATRSGALGFLQSGKMLWTSAADGTALLWGVKDPAAATSGEVTPGKGKAKKK
jgi:WD40 repeat protein